MRFYLRPLPVTDETDRTSTLFHLVVYEATVGGFAQCDRVSSPHIDTATKVVTGDLQLSAASYYPQAILGCGLPTAVCARYIGNLPQGTIESPARGWLVFPRSYRAAKVRPLLNLTTIVTSAPSNNIGQLTGEAID